MDADKLLIQKFNNQTLVNDFDIKLLKSSDFYGGYISANKRLYKEIPNNAFFKNILKESIKGVPLVKIGSTGEKLMVVSGVHGNELPPQLASLYLINYLLSQELNGTIYVIPFVAPNATMHNSRSFKSMDLNRSTLVEGSLTNIIFKLIKSQNIKAVGDFHSTGVNSTPGIEAVFSSLNPTAESYNIGQFISKNIGCKLLNYPKAGDNYNGALEDECNLASIPSVTCEVLSPFGYLKKGAYQRSLLQMYSFLSYFDVFK
ncbi:succinylglutamate desuccinylase/aspartoacylase family protein [uncultured Methanobrevibacter sp.]|uniref:succinylglutamate desuccinylase/aspartoacylase domain-containing protein n=1 Tax=uncultured Methanobrevibacter sp. TaxID=253161 RepID=UPI0025D5A15C|nr:succinylglutamate desuccinylase/aspartoacylase family protein [uncultured Methanobrevibacter sp.]